MAEIAAKPRNRIHFAVRFASSAMRITSVLVILAGAAGTYGVVNMSQIPGTDNLALEPIGTIIVSALIIAFAITFALILWGFADGLVLLADLDDGQRDVQRQIGDLVLAQRTSRNGPWHSETVAAKQEAKQEERALR